MKLDNGEYDNYSYDYSNDYSYDYSYSYSYREPAINKADITPLHRKVATGLLGFMAMFQIKIAKEAIVLQMPDTNFHVCDSIDYSIKAMYETQGEDFSVIDPYGKMATGIDFDYAPFSMEEFKAGCDSAY